MDARTLDDADPIAEARHAAEQRSGAWSGWMLSGGVHAALLVALACVGAIGLRPERFDEPAIVVNPLPRIELPPEPAKTPILANEPITLPRTDPVEFAETPVEVPVTVLQAEEPADEQPQGEPDRQADAETGSTGIFMAIGSGGDGSGMWGNRGPGRRRQTMGPDGGNTPEADLAVEAALRWLKRHQSPDGRWEAVNYPRNCDDAMRCEPGSASAGDVDVAMTGLALLCFLGAGYDHIAPNRHKAAVRSGVEWLVAVQSADGALGKRNYEHAIAAMALAEALGMTGDPTLRDPAQRAMDVLARRQAVDPAAPDPAYGKLGWDYVGANPARSDSSVSGWAVMALKSGLAAGLDVPALHGAKHWLERTWQAANPQAGSRDPYAQSRFPYVYNGVTGAVQMSAGPAQSHDLASVGLVCAIFLGFGAGDPIAESLANYISANHIPASWSRVNLYYLYYGSLGMFQLGSRDQRWQAWNAGVRDLLVANQRKGDGCHDGSWNWDDSVRYHGAETGRVLSTCLATLSLEVYYRYALLAKQPDALKAFRRR